MPKRDIEIAIVGAGMSGLVTGCSSWYLDRDGVPISWPWSAQRFRTEMRKPRFDDYEEIAA
jgi:cation diffusion facilitator CzcD-associated flavoprotein CzcO